MLAVFVLVIAASIGASSRSLGQYARVIGPETASNNSYDFIIAGGGIGGLTVADRLTENPAISVLVVEYGPFDNGEDSVLVPGLYSPGPYFWPNLFSTPQAGLNNQTFFVPIGSVVGGGSTVNAIFFHRGGFEDYDSWEDLGNPGWGWDGLLPYFKKSETFSRPDPAFAKAYNISFQESVHGFNGPIHASYSPYDYAPSKNFWDAALDVGLATSPDPNDGKAVGLFWLLRALDPTTETRSYARIAHYDRVIKTRPNYHLLAEHAVSKVLFKEKTAIGINFITRSAGEVNKAFAKKEVIVAAGAVHSPQILQLSGVGDRRLLEELGIETVVDLPGVGQNFHDQPVVTVSYNFSSNIYPNYGTLATNATYDAEQHALYLSSRQGAYTLIRSTGNNIAIFPLKNATSSAKTILDLAHSEDQVSLLAPGTDTTVIKGYAAQRKKIIDGFSGFNSPIGSLHWNTGPTTSIYMVKPLSRGSITISSSDPLANPLINFGALADPVDLELILALFKKNREIMSTSPMQALGPTELAPYANITGDEELRRILRANIQPSNAHQCCTNAMLKKELGGVVDAGLMVHGTAGLSVVDASIFPFTPAGAPSATVYAVGEKAADIIKTRHGLHL